MWRGGGSILGVTLGTGPGDVTITYTFSLATPPTPALGTQTTYAPHLTAGPTGKCPYRPIVKQTLNGIPFYCNGWDAPWWRDVAKGTFRDMGSVVPTSFNVINNAAPTWLPNGDSVRYYLVFRNTLLGKETSPQVFDYTNSSGSAAGTTITWADPVNEYTHAGIYRRLAGSNTIRLVAEVTIATATYNDLSTDATLRATGVRRYIRRYRETRPPAFAGMSEHEGRLFGWTGLDAFLYFGQQSRVDGEFVEDDFPSANIIPVGTGDGYGVIVAVVSQDATIYVFKRRAIYRITGTPNAWRVKLMYAERGAMAVHCVVPVQDFFVFLDERGLMVWQPGATPVIAAPSPSSSDSSVSSTWKRLNRAVAHRFHGYFLEAEGEVHMRVALDHDPVPMHNIRYDVRHNRIVGVDPGVISTAAGYLEDGAGVEHPCRGDIFGYVWQEEAGNAQGAYSGDTTAPISAGDVSFINASTASFDISLDGMLGTPFDRMDSDGDVIDENIVYGGSSDTLVPFLISSVAVDNTQSLAVGVIPAEAQTGRVNFGTTERAHVRMLRLKCEQEASGHELRVGTSFDADSFTWRIDYDLSQAVPGDIPIRDRGDAIAFKFSQRYAGMDFSMSLLEVHVAPTAVRA